jgi:DNA repair protein RecN (Recombination protein N)
VAEAWRAWRACVKQREAVEQSREMQLERERLEWQVGELDKLAPQPGEWEASSPNTTACRMPPA